MEISKSCSSQFFNLSKTSISQNFPISTKPSDKLSGSGGHNSLRFSKIRFKRIFGPKIRELPQTYLGSFYSKQILKIYPLLSAHHCYSEVLPPKRGLDSKDRPERCLSSRPNQRRVSAFPSISVESQFLHGHFWSRHFHFPSVCAWPQQFSGSFPLRKLREGGICALPYLDDWFVWADSKGKCQSDTHTDSRALFARIHPEPDKVPDDSFSENFLARSRLELVGSGYWPLPRKISADTVTSSSNSIRKIIFKADPSNAFGPSDFFRADRSSLHFKEEALRTSSKGVGLPPSSQVLLPSQFFLALEWWTRPQNLTSWHKFLSPPSFSGRMLAGKAGRPQR